MPILYRGERGYPLSDYYTYDARADARFWPVAVAEQVYPEWSGTIDPEKWNLEQHQLYTEVGAERSHSRTSLKSSSSGESLESNRTFGGPGAEQVVGSCQELGQGGHNRAHGGHHRGSFQQDTAVCYQEYME